MLTFLNLVAVSGILVGLIEGSEQAVRKSSLADVIISEKDGEDHILETETFVRELEAYPEISTFSVRHRGSALLEANYKERRDLKGERDTASVNVVGIDPFAENELSNLSSLVIDGEYLNPEEEGYILLGAFYLKEYAVQFGDVFESVENVKPGDTVRLTVGNTSKEFIVKGIVQSKVDEINLATYLPEREFRRFFGRLTRNADQIVVRTKVSSENRVLAENLRASNLGDLAKIQTFEESLPKFLIDIKNTFNVLGTFIGSIGLVVASITIFIIIFINALARRRHIGILKGIGIERSVIEIAYVSQSAFYALAGSILGAIVIYGFLVPYFAANPIQFPFSDGILSANPTETFYKFVTLFFTTLIAGFIPAWLIARGNTLNAILGRK